MAALTRIGTSTCFDNGQCLSGGLKKDCELFLSCHFDLFYVTGHFALFTIGDIDSVTDNFALIVS